MALEGKVVSISEGAKYKEEVYTYNAEIEIGDDIISVFDPIPIDLDEIKVGEIIKFDAYLLTFGINPLNDPIKNLEFEDSTFILRGKVSEISEYILLDIGVGEVWIKETNNGPEIKPGMWLEVEGGRIDIKGLIE